MKSGVFAFLASLLALAMSFNASAQDLADIPDAAALAEAKKLVQDAYGDLLAAKTDEEKAAAARILVRRADDTDDIPAAKYMMYDTARTMAVEAGDTQAAMDAINGLMGSFKNESDGFLSVASSALQALSRKARNETQYAAVAQAGMQVADKLVAADRQDEAMELLTRLRNSAARSRRPELNNAYKELINELKTIREQTERIADDLKAIERNPNDPALNLSVGKYLVLYRGDWASGLKMLAKSSDEALAAAA